MAENQHRLIKGYRELNETEIALMNRVKAFGPDLAALCNDLRDYITSSITTLTLTINQLEIEPDNETADETAARFARLEDAKAELQRLIEADPMDWLREGRRDVQTGLMKIVRSIAQPTTFV